MINPNDSYTYLQTSPGKEQSMSRMGNTERKDYSNFDHLQNNKNLAKLFSSPNDYKNNFKIKIKCSQALDEKQHYKLQDILGKIERDKEIYMDSKLSKERKRYLIIDKSFLNK